MVTSATARATSRAYRSARRRRRLWAIEGRGTAGAASGGGRVGEDGCRRRSVGDGGNRLASRIEATPMTTAGVPTAPENPRDAMRSPPTATPSENPALNPIRYHVNPWVHAEPTVWSAMYAE